MCQREEELKCTEANEKELRDNLSALSKDMQAVQRKLAKETLRKEMCRALVDQMEGAGRPHRKCAQPQEKKEDKPPITVSRLLVHSLNHSNRQGIV